MSASATDTRKVALFVTCLVDLFRPSVGVAAAELLEQGGCTVDAPRSQTCCGQPAYNSGDRRSAQAVARQVIATFEGYDHVVVPSGSCAGMIVKHYPELFADDAKWRERAQRLAAKTHELISFLHDVLGLKPKTVGAARNATYHDSCSGLRELGVAAQPRALLEGVDGLTLTPLPDADVCCGFGGTFCVKYPEISDRMVSDKARNIVSTGADLLLAGDLGCLLNMAGKLRRLGADVEVRHVAEVLAGLTDEPGIGDAPGERANAVAMPAEGR